MGKITDLWKLTHDEDLELNDDEFELLDRGLKPKKAKKSKKRRGFRKPKSSQQALLSAYKYAGTDEVKTDLIAALEGKPISEDLRTLLEVLVDNDSFRELLLSQCEVETEEEPTEPEYTLRVQYFNSKGEKVGADLIKTLKASKAILSDYGITERIYRVDADGNDIGDASEEDIKKLKKAGKPA